MNLSVDVLMNTAIKLQCGIDHQDRLQRLIATLRQVLECDTSALLRYDSWQFIPLTTDSLAKSVLGGYFVLEGHPQLEAIARAGDVVRFPADGELSDPYDGLIPGQESLKVHACVGLPLFAGQNLIGVLTLGRMQPDQFDVFSDEELRPIAALAAGVLSNALLIEQLKNQNIIPGDATPFEVVRQVQVIGLSPGTTQLKKEIGIVAAFDLNVLISGETGIDKGLIAEAIHEASPRTVDPLVYLGCAVLSEGVAESELFRHMKGAFTGVISNRSGKFETTDDSTLLLGEIGELSLVLQVKLLKVLQYGDIQYVDDDRSLQVDVRALAATSRDLREEALAGRFCADLFHRLSVFPLSAPPLHGRGDDVILLAGYFCEQCRLRLGLPRVALSAGARNLLRRYRFPGNIHELKHAIRRAVMLARAAHSGDEVTVEAQHFAFPEMTLPSPEAAAVPIIKQNLCEATEAFQRETIRRALTQNHHSWAACTWMLEIDAANLHRLAKRLGLED